MSICSYQLILIDTFSYLSYMISSEKETDTLYGADVIIVEGILILHNKSIRDQFDMRIYVDEEDDVRLARRVKRDIAERGRTVEEVLYQYLHTVKPAFDQFIRPVSTCMFSTVNVILIHIHIHAVSPLHVSYTYHDISISFRCMHQYISMCIF